MLVSWTVFLQKPQSLKLVLRSLVSLGLISHTESYGSSVILPVVSSFPVTSFQETGFQYISRTFVKNEVFMGYKFISGSSILFHWCTCLLLCQHRADFVAMALQYIFFLFLTCVCWEGHLWATLYVLWELSPDPLWEQQRSPAAEVSLQSCVISIRHWETSTRFLGLLWLVWVLSAFILNFGVVFLGRWKLCFYGDYVVSIGCF